MKYDELPQKARQILDKITYVTLATVNTEGSPWNSPVYYAADQELNIYWSSHPESVHSQNIMRRGQVFAVVFDSTSQDGEGIYMEAQAKVVEDRAEISEALALLGRRRGKPFNRIDKFMSPGPQRIFKAVPQRLWMNDADQDEEGDFIRDFRIEL